MAKKYVRENVPLSRFGVLVAQLESIVASSSQQPPEALLCFDLLSDLISAIDEEPKVFIASLHLRFMISMQIYDCFLEIVWFYFFFCCRYCFWSACFLIWF